MTYRGVCRVHENDGLASALRDVLVLELLRVRQTVALVELPAGLDRDLSSKAKIEFAYDWEPVRWDHLRHATLPAAEPRPAT